MKIDAFTHILTPKYKETFSKKGKSKSSIFAYADAIPTLMDLDIRFKIMDQYQDLVQVLTITGPPAHGAAAPKDAVELAKIANDEMAELIMKYPDRFVSAVACLPLTDMDATLKEVDRTITELRFRGVEIFSDIGGKPIDSPEFMPLYEKMAYYDLPIWLHPVRKPTVPDYVGEDASRYLVYMIFGYPYESTVAMTRLVFSGVFDKFPNLKVITHHCGGTVPYLGERIRLIYDQYEMRQGFKYEQPLTKSLIDYYRMFYNDTAVNGSTSALMCGYDFFGAEHILFGTDMPFDSQIGYRYVRETIRSIEEMGIPDSEKKKIFEGNARRIMRLPI
jgi:predicted TIM-barrel fold metal-dependent hydrolase